MGQTARRWAGTGSRSSGRCTPSVSTVGSTVPANGDLNPYDTALVKKSTGDLRRGNVFVSSFNNAANQQGTGITLVQISPKARPDSSLRSTRTDCRARARGGVRLTTALSILPGGWVVVGSLPTTDGTSATAQAGCLIVLDKHGKVREPLSGKGINGPWDMTAKSHGDRTDLFVTNVLNGTVAGGGGDVVREGTVLRITCAATTTGRRPVSACGMGRSMWRTQRTTASPRSRTR
ncbi:hypothetical protein [Streptomyces sp. NPDC059209]|uniref:hypothetical protein n=1 Tax=Streptomyces sp. NPDC059209 TaxID=3346769 RepID=UPI0036C785CF